MTNCSAIENSESMFNYHLVWPLLSLVVKTATLPARYSLFKTGGTILGSSDEIFKADGAVELDGIEFCLLETSGVYKISDSSQMPTKDVQVLEHLSYTDIPADVSQVDKVLNLGNLVWKLNVS
ncbi:hypothetical protein CU097_012355 [Rhizopus azygosporus]|uniref:Uncharacterized protein n=1 Tax=Rhizopus azygosporus TaxID=86630 RepID=A0A367K6L5_RHIAZ|nr:hypothetical protein CU097_012355 [Rhizopus azygosporus]